MLSDENRGAGDVLEQLLQRARAPGTRMGLVDALQRDRAGELLRAGAPLREAPRPGRRPLRLAPEARVRRLARWICVIIAEHEKAITDAIVDGLAVILHMGECSCAGDHKDLRAGGRALWRGIAIGRLHNAALRLNAKEGLR